MSTDFLLLLQENEPTFSKGQKRIADFMDEWKEILSIYRFVAKEDIGNG